MFLTIITASLAGANLGALCGTSLAAMGVIAESTIPVVTLGGAATGAAVGASTAKKGA